MREQDDIPEPTTPTPGGVEEARAPFFHSKPAAEERDWDAMIAEIRRRFPKTLARLAE